MPPITYANQRTITIHREAAKRDFLGIKNENWQNAAKDLRPHAFLLYLYLASNADNYNLALSPVAVRAAVGMPRSTYNDQLHILIDKGYLVPSHGNTYDFYEVPREKNNLEADNASRVNNSQEDCPNADNKNPIVVNNCPTENLEINTSTKSINNKTTNIEKTVPIEVPKVKEIVITRPIAEGRNRTAYNPTKKKDAFVF